MLLPPRSALRVLRCPPGGLIHLGAARRWIALPPARPAVFTLDKLGRPGWWGVWRSGIKEEAAGRGTAAAPNATPAWSATRPRCTTQLHRVPNKLARPGRWGVWRSGIKEEAAGRGTAAAPNATPAWSATPPRYTTQQIASKLGTLRGGVVAPTLAAARAALPPRGGEPRLGAARRRIPLPPRSALRVLRCPPRGRTPPWGGPAAGLFGQGA